MRESRLDTFVTVEINILNPENILNTLSRQGVFIRNIRRINIALIRLDLYEEDLGYVKKIVKKNNGRLSVIEVRGKSIIISVLKRRSSLIIGGVLFLGIIYFLSTHIWSIEILTEKNVSPYEVREILDEFGVYQGMSKSKLNVYDLEKKLEDASSEIVWARIRMEGSTLKVKIEEKVNPPKLLYKDLEDVVAKMDGEVKRVYAKNGTIVVSPGDMVKKGDVLIEPYSGSEGNEFATIADGEVIANTFYEKEVEVQVAGKKLERTGKSEKDIFIIVFGKKIYLKKATNTFEDYDKIEDNEGFIKKIEYLEKEKREIYVEKETVIDESVNKLEKLLLKDLTNEAKVVDKKVDITDIGEGMVHINVQFVVEQNIAI